MLDVAGDFEIHITVHAHQAEKLSAFAAQHGLKFVHIELDRGRFTSQPMITLTGQGTLAEQRASVQRWQRDLREAGMYPCRSKIEAAPWCGAVVRRRGASAYRSRMNRRWPSRRAGTLSITSNCC